LWIVKRHGRRGGYHRRRSGPFERAESMRRGAG